MKSWRNYYTNDNLDYTQLNSVGGWLIFLIIRLAFSITSSVFGIVQAVRDVKPTYIALYVFILFIATATIILIFMKRKQLRFTYYAFSAASLLDYFLAQDASAFIGCMLVEAGWIFYLLVSVRVKLLVGEMKILDESENDSISHK